METDFVLNMMDITDFPDLPAKKLIVNNFASVLTEPQSKKFEDIKITELECREIEQNTRLQRRDLR